MQECLTINATVKIFLLTFKRQYLPNLGETNLADRVQTVEDMHYISSIYLEILVNHRNIQNRIKNLKTNRTRLGQNLVYGWTVYAQCATLLPNCYTDNQW